MNFHRIIASERQTYLIAGAFSDVNFDLLVTQPEYEGVSSRQPNPANERDSDSRLIQFKGDFAIVESGDGEPRLFSAHSETNPISNTTRQ